MSTSNNTPSPLLTLAGEPRLPTVGFGTYLIQNSDAEAVVGAALRTGYRHVDTAEAYRNEEGVGRAVRSFLRDQDLPRTEVFVTTKLWPGHAAWGETEKDYAATLYAFDQSLERLGLDYVDLYLIHAPFSQEHRLEQWRALVELKRSGRAKAIGVSNYDEAHILEILNAGLPTPDADQIELHPWSQKPDLVRFLRDQGILPIAYSSLVPLSSWRAAEGQASAKTAQMTADGERTDSPFKSMAEKYGITEAQVLLRWAVQSGYAVLPKSANPDRMRQNLDLFSFEIDEGDMQDMGTMNRGGGVAWSVGDPTAAR